MKTLLICTSVFLSSLGFSQFSPIEGTSGKVYNSEQTDFVKFNTTFTSTCSIRSFGENNYCGIYFPDIEAVWSGNTNDSISTISFTFSEAIYAIDIMIGVVGINGELALETFLFTTDGNTPSVSVNSGNCKKWTINKNEITSPKAKGAFTGIATITSKTPFKTLNIITDSSGTGAGSNGGSNFAICQASMIKDKDAGQLLMREAGVNLKAQ